MAKFKLEDLQNEAQENGFTLLSTEYKNMETELQYQCPKGHPFFLTYKKIRHKYECPICNEFNGYTGMEIVNEATAKPKGTFRILAFDQSSKISGFAIFDNDTLVKYGMIEIKGRIAPARFIKVRNWVKIMIDNWNPDLIILEDIQMQSDEVDGIKGIVTYKVLSELLGVLETLLFENDIEYELANVATWRSVEQVDGRKREDKKTSAKLRVEKCYSITVTDDIADAILIGRYAVNKRKDGEYIENEIHWE